MSLLIYKLIFVAVIIASAAGYFYYSQNRIEKLNAEVANFKAQASAALKAYKICKVEKTRQVEAINSLTKKNVEITKDVSRYLNIFKRHNLTKLAEVKPGLIETRINKSTQQLFGKLEDDTTDKDMPPINIK
jgi:hypothetical protein